MTTTAYYMVYCIDHLYDYDVVLLLCILDSSKYIYMYNGLLDVLYLNGDAVDRVYIILTYTYIYIINRTKLQAHMSVSAEYPGGTAHILLTTWIPFCCMRTCGRGVIDHPDGGNDKPFKIHIQHVRAHCMWCHACMHVLQRVCRHTHVTPSLLHCMWQCQLLILSFLHVRQYLDWRWKIFECHIQYVGKMLAEIFRN